MSISLKIERYIEDSKINGRLCKWDKPFVNVFVMQITSGISNKNLFYSEVNRAINIWNNVLKQSSINLTLNIVNEATNADIVVHWTKVGRVFEGMCKYPSVINGVFKKISIDIGLPNEFSGKNTTIESIFSTILHELGHSLGLGHGVDIDDVMYVPHQKNVSVPSENDIYVLKQIYLN